MSNKVLILGPSGRFGRHAAEAFWNAGWQVTLFDRQTDSLDDKAMNADVIVNGWNPPYNKWLTELPKQTQSIIAAARKSGATVLIPGNIYGYGDTSPSLLTATTPKAARNPLGRVRNQMEEAFRSAGVRTIVVRAGDFIDTQASGNWFDKIIAANLGKGRVVSPGDIDALHSWAYLPDLGRAAVALAERRQALDPFQEVLFPGFTLSIRDMATLLETLTGQRLTIKRLNWLPIQLARPFWPLAGGLLEVRYLWSMPHRLDEADMTRLLPGFRATDPLTGLAHAVGQFKIDPDQTVTGRRFDVAAE